METAQQEQLALTGGQTTKIQEGKDLKEEDIKDLKKKRDSNIVWLNDRWIYKEIQPFIHQANKLAGWNFDWDFSESCQFTKYKLNQFYDWHCDSWEAPYINPDNKETHGKIRKLSVTCSLSDPKNYKGGELEFDFRNMDPDKPTIRKCAEIAARGSIVVFPSHVWHRVKPVTKGTRYSLVIWNLGYPFK
jgi:PKHD-type hydroxylase